MKFHPTWKDRVALLIVLVVCVGLVGFSGPARAIPDANGESRGVVVEGPVGSSLLARLRVFRYEVRRWRNGRIPDAAYAVESPQRVCDDVHQARRLLALAPCVPPLKWGRDELRIGDMWNSNSVVSWLFAASSLPADRIQPPQGGRAPGWKAGLELARRQLTGSDPSIPIPEQSRLRDPVPILDGPMARPRRAGRP